MDAFRGLVPRSPRGNKIAALVAGSPTLILLTLFTFGETGGSDLGGLSHLLQLVPLAALLAAGWRYPHACGLVLLGSSLILVLAYPLFARGAGLSPAAALVCAALFLLPPVAAGALLLRAAMAEDTGERPGAMTDPG